MGSRLSPDVAPARLVDLSGDVRAAVLLDAAGTPIASSERAGPAAELAELARSLLAAVDAAPGPPAEQVEVQAARGTVYLSRTPRWTLAAVARRGALSSLMLMDLRAVLRELELEGAPA